MKHFFCLIFLSAALLNAQTPLEERESFLKEFIELIYNKPFEDLSEEDFQDEYWIKSFLFNKEISPDQKRHLFEKVYANPGSFPTGILFFSGICYLQLKEFEKAALLYIGGFGRSEIDTRLSQDRSDDGLVTETLLEEAQRVINCFHLTEEENQSWLAAKKAALNHFPKWDQETPRNYSDDEESQFNEEEDDEKSQFTEKEKALVISRFYREIIASRIPEIEEGEDFFAADDDHYFFDSKNRIYHLDIMNDRYFSTGNRLAFQVPQHITPILWRYGEYDGTLQLSGRGILSVNCSNTHSKLESTLRERSVEKRSGAIYAHENHVNFLLGNYFWDTVEAYENEDIVVNRIYVPLGSNICEFVVHCSEEEEEECLKDLELLLGSLMFTNGS